MRARSDQVLHAVVVVTWGLLALTLGDTIAAALATTSELFTLVVGVGAWVGWAATLLALVVPRTVSLTVVRHAVPAGLAAGTWAQWVAPEVTVVGIVGLTLAAVAAALVLSAPLGDRFANGSAYGGERRFLLRPPAALLFGPLELSWVLVVAGATAGPLLLAAEVWIAGALAVAAGWPLTWFVLRRAHLLSRRWVVLVPAGIVVHDPMAMADSLLVLRKDVAHLGPALAETDTFDLTLGALGLALELAMRTPQEILTQADRRAAGGSLSATREVDAVLVTPSRPGALVRAAAEARIPVG